MNEKIKKMHYPRRYSPTQTSRLIPSTMAGGGGIASPPAGVRTGPVGSTDGPWLPPHQLPQMPQAPPQLPAAAVAAAAIYPPPTGPSFSRRGRPPSDVNAPRQEPPGYSGEASAPVPQPRPSPSAQNQVHLRSYSNINWKLLITLTIS